MCIVRFAIPVVRAVFVRREDFLARLAHAITGDIGIRSGMLFLTTWTIPIVFAIGIQGVGCFARFAIPQMIAMNGRHIRLLAGRAEPIIFRANVIHRVMRFADRACPVVLAMLRFF